MAKIGFNYIEGELGTLKQIKFAPSKEHSYLKAEVNDVVGFYAKEFFSKYEGDSVEKLLNNISKLENDVIEDVVLDSFYVSSDFASVRIQFLYEGYAEVEGDITFFHDNPYWIYKFTNF